MNAIDAQHGDKVWLEHQGLGGLPIIDACLSRIESLGASAEVFDSGGLALKVITTNATQDDLMVLGRERLSIMQSMNKYIRVGDSFDQAESGLSAQARADYEKFVMSDVTNHRVDNTDWLVLRAPTEGFAKACGMELPAFESFYVGACLADYDKMKVAAEPLKALMGGWHDVHIVGEHADLILATIGGGRSKSCVGVRNIPDGEVYTAPIVESVNGWIEFAPSVYRGEHFKSICLEFQNGVVVDAVAENAERTGMLNQILDVDESARKIGEFALAFNPHIHHPVGEVLFDEKIAGSLHLALGTCYRNVANNGNHSGIHWDMVHIQTPEYGGGEIFFDGQLIRRDGEFVVPELQGLNPENLLG